MLDDERSGRLFQAKLTSLVRDNFGGAEVAASAFPDGAAAVAGSRGWVLVEGSSQRSLGRALLWAGARGLDDLDLIVSDHAADLARRASHFVRPAAVWQLDGTALLAASPAPPPMDPAPPVGTEDIEAMLLEAGLDVVCEGGVLTGEYRGLEVARVVEGPLGPELQVGIGRFDREAGALMQGERSTEERLAAAVELVRRHRGPGADEHPLKRLAPERSLRSDLIADPGVVGAAWLRSVATTIPRENLRDPHPAAALGEDPTGAPLVVVCSVGVDPDLVPLAADVRAARSPHAELVIVVPRRDAHPATETLAASLLRPARVLPYEEA